MYKWNEIRNDIRERQEKEVIEKGGERSGE